MRFTELVLHNFGIYKGRHTIDLGKGYGNGSVVLIGALNGSGKTTILEAVQLALYGAKSPFLNSFSGGYSSYIKSSFNRFAKDEAAAIELSFMGELDGRFGEYKIFRTWKGGARIHEEVQVLRYGLFEQLLSETWSDLVEELLPSKVADLFFFDGERIESLADPLQSAGYLKTAINALLGLDVVKNLERDLGIVERQKRKGAVNAAERVQLEELEEKFRVMVDNKKSLQISISDVDQKTALNNQKSTDLEKQLKELGGDLYAKRNDLHAKRAELEKKIAEIKSDTIREVSGIQPLSLVQSLFDDAARLLIKKQTHLSSIAKLDAVNEYHDKLVKLFAKNGDGSALDLLQKALPTRPKLPKSEEAYLNLLGNMDRNRLNDSEAFCEDLRFSISGASNRFEMEVELSKQLELIDRTIAAVPNEIQVKGLIDKISVLQVELVELRNECTSYEDSLGKIEFELEKLEKLRAALLEKELQDKDLKRICDYSSKVRTVLKQFEERLRAQNVSSLEALVQESFAQLMRKKSLITKVSICPDTCQLSLFTDEGLRLSADQLSAGERQLLAIAILWALKRASKRDIPMMVDTPLGRLDDTHRRLLVENYFSKVSHQIVLLSTDVEITGEHYDNLKPWVYAEYTLEYHEDQKTTLVHSGYLNASRRAA